MIYDFLKLNKTRCFNDNGKASQISTFNFSLAVASWCCNTHIWSAWEEHVSCKNGNKNHKFLIYNGTIYNKKWLKETCNACDFAAKLSSSMMDFPVASLYLSISVVNPWTWATWRSLSSLTFWSSSRRHFISLTNDSFWFTASSREACVDPWQRCYYQQWH